MRLKIIYLILFIWLLIFSGQVEAQIDPANELITLVNQLRNAYGFTPYRIDFTLTNVAQIHANWLAANDLNTHIGPEGLDPDERAKRAGYGASYDAFVIENIATGDRELRSPELVVSLWEEDPEKLNAMISPNYEDIGVGYVEAYGKTWFVMMVGWIDDEEAEIGTAEEIEGAIVNEDGDDSPVREEMEENGPIYHEVQPGESAWSIATFYEIDIWELLSLNNLPEDVVLQPGDKLVIRPVPTLIPSATPPTQPATETPMPPETSDSTVVEQNNFAPTEAVEPIDSTNASEESTFFSDPFNLVGTVIFLILLVVFIYRLIQNWL